MFPLHQANRTGWAFVDGGVQFTVTLAPLLNFLAQITPVPFAPYVLTTGGPSAFP